MPRIAGFHCEIDRADAKDTPLVLLHGSGQDESDLRAFAEQIAPAAPAIRLRGNIVWQGGHAFFRRRPDRSLDLDDLARALDELALFVEALAERMPGRAPCLAGYSNGAIAAAALATTPGMATRGAILMRPLSPDPTRAFAALPGYPVLILAGRNDERRAPGDSFILAEQFQAAGARVSHHVMDCGHGWEEQGLDVELTRQWLEQLPPDPAP